VPQLGNWNSTYLVFYPDVECSLRAKVLVVRSKTGEILNCVLQLFMNLHWKAVFSTSDFDLGSQKLKLKTERFVDK
jgi:hypothetical protein